MAPSALLAVLARSQDAGFLGPGPVEAHVEHAAAFVGAVDAPSSYLDLGSGGGVPGLVLALAWPAATGVLLDAQARRVRFLESAIADLDLTSRLRAVHGRAEDLARDRRHRAAYDVVTARSFGPPAITAECGRGFLVAGGLLLVAEPPDDPERWPAAGLRSLDLEDSGAVTAGGATVRRLRAVSQTPPAQVPRRAAAVRRRPAF
jgi:16S rRNA (guanine527-N7)-methyltransferase